MDSSQIEKELPENHQESAPEEKLVTRQLPDNPLFAFEEEDTPAHSGNSDNEAGGLPLLEVERRAKRVQRRNPNTHKALEFRPKDLVLKTKNRLMGAVNLATEVGMDQVRFETLNLDPEDAALKFMEVDTQETLPKFDKFITKNSETAQTVEPVAALGSAIIQQIEAIDPSDSEEVELQIAEPVYQSQSEALLKNTTKIRSMVEEPSSFPFLFPKREKVNTLTSPQIRTREDLVKAYAQNMEEKRRGLRNDPERLQQVFKTVTYQEMDEQRRLKRQQKAEEAEHSASEGVSYDSEERVVEKEAEDDHPPSVASDNHPKNDQPDPQNPEAQVLGEEIIHPVEREEEFSEPESRHEAHGHGDGNQDSPTFAEQWLVEDNPFAAERQKRRDEIARVTEELKKQQETYPKVTQENGGTDSGTKSRLKTLAARREEIKSEKRAERERLRAKERARQRKVGRAYFEVEAELGSENEQNDAVVKNIDRNAESEQEDDAMDQSDEELINRNELDFDPENELRAEQKYLEDMIKADEEELRHIEEGVFFQKAQRNARLVEARRDEIQERGQRLRDMLSWLEGRGKEPGEGQPRDPATRQNKNLSGLNVFDEEETGPRPTETKFSAADFLREMEDLKKLNQAAGKDRKPNLLEVKEKALSVLPVMTGKKIQFSQVGYQKLLKPDQTKGPARAFYAAKDKDLDRQKFEDD